MKLFVLPATAGGEESELEVRVAAAFIKAELEAGCEVGLDGGYEPVAALLRTLAADYARLGWRLAREAAVSDDGHRFVAARLVHDPWRMR